MIKNGLKERRFEMNGKSKLNVTERLGTATEGLGSERYQLVKKMVIGGALRGTVRSIMGSGLMIGSGTAKKYNAALIRDGVIRSNNPPEKHPSVEEIKAAILKNAINKSNCYPPFLDNDNCTIGSGLISEERMFYDFLSFLRKIEESGTKSCPLFNHEQNTALNFANFDLIREVMMAFCQIRRSMGDDYKYGIEIEIKE